MKRAVLVVGAAGAGKSTFINTVTETDEATVSHKLLTDGTCDLVSIRAPFDNDLVLIDTPGLNSANFPVSMTEKVQVLCPDKNLLIMLVINKNNARITDYIRAFERLYGELVGSDKTFLIVWTHAGELSEENRLDVEDKFPRAILFHDTGVAGIKAHLLDHAIFSPQKRNIARPVVPPRPLQSSVPMRVVVSRVAVNRTKQLPRALNFCLPPTVTAKIIADCAGVAPSGFAPLLQDVLKVKVAGGPEYRNKRLMGDAFLKPIVMSFLASVKEDTTLESTTLPLIGNDKDCAMPRFFEKYIKDEFVKLFPDPAEYNSTHHQADIVEVLFELSRTKKKGGVIIAFIITELFKLVGLQRVVDKVKNLCA